MYTPAPEQDAEALPLGVIESARPSFSKRVRRALLGDPLSSDRMEHTLLPKRLALPVFASDAISSVAYATQEILLVLGGAGFAAASLAAAYHNYTMLLAGLIVLLLVIVATSYQQTIHAYPNGGGSYIVSKENLGTNWGLIAAGALLIDYVLTVSVSIAAGVQNLASIPFVEATLHPDRHLVLFCLFFIALLTLANLRGLKESGAFFAIPTYVFVVMCYLMIAVGLLGPMFGWRIHTEYINQDLPHAAEGAAKSGGTLLVLVLMKAFASGCSAMTGTEAVSNGIPAFKPPKSRNASMTLIAMAVILGTIFLGISWLAMSLHVVYTHDSPAVIDQISGAVFGKTGATSALYLLTQIFTASILVLAANTSFADFPRLASILAHDRFLPKQLSNLGDRLVFGNGILLLGIAAGALVVGFGGSVDRLIPLYAVGVFTAFTLSQSGMVRHWQKERGKGWQSRAAVNTVGALATGIVLFVVAFEKFFEGAWAVILLVALLVIMFRKIHGHYADMAEQLKMKHYVPPAVPFTNTVIALIPSLHRGVMPALEYARSLSPDCRAVHIETDPEKTPTLRARWEEYGGDVPLVVLNSAYRSVIGPLMAYLNAVQSERKNHLVTVVLPEFVPTRWWHSLLHGNTGLLLKIALLGRSGIVVANVRYYLQETEAPAGETAFEEEAASAASQGVPEGHAA